MNEKPYAITLDVGSSLANKTGSWRTERAVYVDRLPPCNHACPAGENIQAWLYEAEEGEEGYERAWRKLMEDNPLPAVMGRVCYHPCETACNRGQLDEAVGIHSVERFLGDEAIKRGWQVEFDVEPSGKRVLVVGAGPSGLSAAYHLTRLGHEVTIHEAGPMPGGMMRFGIPQYRLPRDVLEAEVRRILDLGVTLELNRKVDNVRDSMREGGFDAAFLAVGAHIGRRAYVPAGEAERIVDAVALLESMEGEEKPQLGRRVVVYGGGDTAMDVARTAKRLGATDAVVVYRRTRERMPAHDFEVEEAAEEGVMMKWLSTVKHFEDGKLLLERMELDETGFPQPTGETEELEADSLVLALGQEADLSLLEGVPGIESRRRRRAGRSEHDDRPRRDLRRRRHGPGRAHGHGRRRPRQEGGPTTSTAGYAVPITPRPQSTTWRASTPSTPGTTRTRRAPSSRSSRRRGEPPASRRSSAASTSRTPSSKRAAASPAAACFSCDNCYGVCPDNAVIKLGNPGELYEIDLDFCKGCGLCVEECPSGAIEMVPEEI